MASITEFGNVQKITVIDGVTCVLFYENNNYYAVKSPEQEATLQQAQRAGLVVAYVCDDDFRYVIDVQLTDRRKAPAWM